MDVALKTEGLRGMLACEGLGGQLKVERGFKVVGHDLMWRFGLDL